MSSQLQPSTQAGSDPGILLRSVLKSPAHSHHNRQLAQQIVWDWVGSKWPRLVPSLAERERSTFTCALPGRRLSLANSADGAAWMLEVAHSERDNSRTWTTTALVADTGDADLVAVQTSCTDLPSARAVAPPKVLGHWVQRLAFEDAGWAVEGEPRLVQDDEQLDAFCAHVLQRGRTLPVIALANKPGTRYYGIDPRGLAESVRGLAHVACVAPDAVAEIAHRFGRRFAPVAGAVRLYVPGFTAEDEARDHPLIRQVQPPKDAGDGDAPADHAAFRRYVCRRVCAVSVGAHGGPDFFEDLLPSPLA
jgi:hypothetical protein